MSRAQGSVVAAIAATVVFAFSFDARGQVAPVVVAAAAQPERARVELEVSPPTAQVIVDDRVVGRGSQPLSLAPGAHRVRVRAANYTVQEVSVEVAAGETRALRVDLRPFRPTVWPWVVLGVGAAGTAVAIAGVLATLPYAASFDRPVRVRFEGR